MSSPSPKFVSPNELSIIIDNITFTLLVKSELNRRYKDVVRIQSSSDDNNFQTFWVYRSCSEMGFWRLCSKRYDDILIYKGQFDYVQSTFIHFSLQQFLNDKLEMIPRVTLSADEKLDQCFCANLLTSKCNIVDVHDVIDDVRRAIIGEDPFKYMHNLEKIGILGCGIVPDKTTQYNFNDKMKYFAAVFNNDFNAKIDDIVKLYDYQFNFENIINADCSVYSLKLERKKKNASSRTNDVTLYFLTSKFKEIEVENKNLFSDNVSKVCNKKIHILPCFLTISNVKINKYGLFTKFIPCGAYICKMFDYYSDDYNQCTVEEKLHERCNFTYAYIGHRYDNLFPLNLALAHLQDNCILLKPSNNRKSRRRYSNRKLTKSKSIRFHKKLGTPKKSI